MKTFPSEFLPRSGYQDLLLYYPSPHRGRSATGPLRLDPPGSAIQTDQIRGIMTDASDFLHTPTTTTARLHAALVRALGVHISSQTFADRVRVGHRPIDLQRRGGRYRARAARRRPWNSLSGAAALVNPHAAAPPCSTRGPQRASPDPRPGAPGSRPASPLID